MKELNNEINPFHATGLFFTPLKHRKTSGFLIFSGNTERDPWRKMG